MTDPTGLTTELTQIQTSIINLAVRANRSLKLTREEGFSAISQQRKSIR